MAKKLRCHLGLHAWVERVNEGATYLVCRHCGAYSDRAASIIRYGGRK